MEPRFRFLFRNIADPDLSLQEDKLVVPNEESTLLAKWKRSNCLCLVAIKRAVLGHL